jgi:hypothetical protein
MPGTSPGKGPLMGWFRRFWRHRAAKQYARKLGPQLARAYGPSEHYSAPQIRTAVAKLGLNRKYIALGYAGCLPEDAFAAVVADMPSRIPYQAARDLFDRFRPPALFSASANPEMSINLVQAGVSDHPDLS